MTVRSGLSGEPRPGLTRGLTLGKYAPLHRGHQLVIETALAEMDEVIVIIYDSPEVTLIPLPVRAGWLRTLYPQIMVIEAWDGPHEVGDTPAIRSQHEDYILNTLGITGITHFYSSEFYGEHMSRALGAVDRRVDPARTRFPVSGTAIRADSFAYRNFIDPVVYRDLIVNVCFLGAPSTGKTTIAARMAAEYGTVWMPEYGREYWEANQIARRLTPDQLVAIAEGHLARENRLLEQANRVLFSDTTALTTYLFALYYHGSAPEQLRRCAVESAARYDLVFVCDTDIPYDDTWDRSGEGNRYVFQRQLLSELAIRKIPYFTLRGDPDSRVQAVRRVVDRFTKYQPILW